MAITGCVTKKKMYSTPEIAEEELIHAWSTYEYAPGYGPVAVYKCEDCGHYHLTSSGPMNAKLADYLRDGKIKRQKEANRWIGKINKKR